MVKKESKMNENNEQARFESRVLTDLFDVLAVINHLEDNLDGDKPLKVILTMKLRGLKETEEEPCIETILVENKKEILNISKLLDEKLFMADIHVAIE